jgi:hypothetical protein
MWRSVRRSGQPTAPGGPGGAERVAGRLPSGMGSQGTCGPGRRLRGPAGRRRPRSSWSKLAGPTLIAAVGDVAHSAWRGAAIGVCGLWRDIGFAVGAVLAT